MRTTKEKLKRIILEAVFDSIIDDVYIRNLSNEIITDTIKNDKQLKKDFDKKINEICKFLDVNSAFKGSDFEREKDFVGKWPDITLVGVSLKNKFSDIQSKETIAENFLAYVYMTNNLKMLNNSTKEAIDKKIKMYLRILSDVETPKKDNSLENIHESFVRNIIRQELKKNGY